MLIQKENHNINFLTTLTFTYRQLSFTLKLLFFCKLFSNSRKQFPAHVRVAVSRFLFVLCAWSWEITLWPLARLIVRRRSPGSRYRSPIPTGVRTRLDWDGKRCGSTVCCTMYSTYDFLFNDLDVLNLILIINL